MKQPILCSCILCKKQTSDQGIVTHFLRSHGTAEQKQLFANNYMAGISAKAKKEFNKHPKLCKECKSEINYEHRTNNFCSHSCAGAFSNRKRIEAGWTLTTEQKAKISRTVIKYNISIGNKTKANHETIKTASGNFSRVYFIKCKFCNETFTAKTTIQVCPDCQHLKWKNHKDQWSFKFNVFEFPDLFDLVSLTNIGWVQFGGNNRRKLKNLTGLSRDHMVSVDFAKKNNCDPYYISHPCNCEIMPHTENNSKKTKSSISYEELIVRVNEYDKKWGRKRESNPQLFDSHSKALTN